MKQLREKTFRGWPQGDEVEELDVKQVAIAERDGLTVRALEFNSQTPYRLPLYVVQTTEQSKSKVAQLDVAVLDQNGWKTVSGGLASAMPDHFGAAVAANEDEWAKLKMLAQTAPDVALAYCVTRDVGPTLWSQDERKRTHIRRRFMQLGQTADGMKIWDICRALRRSIRLMVSSQRSGICMLKDKSLPKLCTRRCFPIASVSCTCVTCR